RLREWAYNRKRADIIIVTKCPKEISQREREELSGRLCVSESQRIFFTTIKYGVPYSINNDKELINLEQLSVDSSILLLSGIASPQQMYSHIRQFTDNIEMLTFGDHHNYTLSDIYSLKLKLSKISATRKFILTTEKDAARLREMNLEEDLRKFIYVLPIEMSFINDGTIFDNCIIEHLNRYIYDQ
ncbi:MAG: tetraacyldisaccharide 4'-kinase, partial [Bacteroidaceae bacterium]|nr:tetraacyldisaccharide 4'-kinase [Bacteroidaceae bacterium]